MKDKEIIILGIDPGTTIMGFGVIIIKGEKMNLLELNELGLRKEKDHYTKLKLIFDRTIQLIEKYNPDEISVEAPFFGKNVQSMLKLGRAQGVAMAAGLSREIIIKEYSPKKIKSDWQIFHIFCPVAIFNDIKKTRKITHTHGFLRILRILNMLRTSRILRI